MVRAAKSQLERRSTTQSAERVPRPASAPAFVDNRPETIAQRKLADTIDNSPTMVAQRMQLGSWFGEAAQLKARTEQQESLQGMFAPVQRKCLKEAAYDQECAMPSGPSIQLQHEATPQKNATGLPDSLKIGVESLSGISLDNVRVHYNSSQPARLEALAYAQGTDIHVAPGAERHLPHEAWHVVQQAQGRVQPTTQMKDAVPINDDRGLEHEADVMGGKAAVVGHLAVPSRPFQSPTQPAEAQLDAAGIKLGLAPQATPTHDVIQPWRDQNGKWYDPPPATPDSKEWESFEFGPKKETRWRPKKGSEAEKEELKVKEEALKKSEAAKEAAEKRATKWATMSTDYKTIFYEDSAHILYTQDSIAGTFTSGKSIQSLVTALKNDEVKPSDVEPIMVELFEDRLYSYDNRRLWAFKKAKLKVRCRFASPSERQKNAFKLTGDGKTIKIRK